MVPAISYNGFLIVMGAGLEKVVPKECYRYALLALNLLLLALNLLFALNY